MNEFQKANTSSGLSSDQVAYNNLEFIIKNGCVDVSQVSSRYPNTVENVLSKLTFTIEKGKKIGIVGRTGCGKTSMLKLFWRCLDYQKGDIKIDGKDIKECDLKILRREMDIISQETS